MSATRIAMAALAVAAAAGALSAPGGSWAASAVGQRPDPPEAFRAGVELVALSVTVTGSDNRHVPGLGRHDFVVFEDGIRQDLSYFAAGRVPLDLVIMIDTSSSMRHKMSLVQQAASGFARTIRPGDRAQIVGFARTVTVLEPFTGDVAALEAAIRRAGASGGTSLHNAVYIVLQEFARLSRESPGLRRQAVVLLTDGSDTASLISFEDILEHARRSGVAIYPISILSDWESRELVALGRARSSSAADHALRVLARDTGAMAFFPRRLFELDGVYRRIAEELATQYVLGYPPAPGIANGVFRRVTVQVVTRPGATARTRSGYYATGTPADSTGR